MSTSFRGLLVLCGVAYAALSGTAFVQATVVETVEDAAASSLDTLPGNTAFLFTEICDDTPVPIYGVRAEQRMAVGSSFKLYILGTLKVEPEKMIAAVSSIFSKIEAALK